MDEPSMGLAPMLVESVFELIGETNALGITVLIVEQNATLALSCADRGYVIQNGRIVLTDTGERLLTNAQLRTAYLGG
jgi:branched-chain amino acid transport system ATP-binding protein